MPKVVREYEILRVAAVVTGEHTKKPAHSARQEVLAWAQKRSGTRLPKEAWDHQDFESFSGGRNSIGVRIESEDADIWAIRAEDPDKEVPGRIWTTEVVIGTLVNEHPRFSARLLASTSEDHFEVEPHVPGFVQQITEKCGLSRDGQLLNGQPWIVSSPTDAWRLCVLMTDPARKIPLFVLTVPEGAEDQTKPLIDARSLTRATLGIAFVAVVPAEFTWVLTEEFGKLRSVFGGAARVYLPGFAEDSSPYDHRLIIADHLRSPEGPTHFSKWMRILAGNESVRQTLIGNEVLAFAAIRVSSLRLKQERLEKEGASDTEQLKAAQERILSLEKQMEDDQASLEYFAFEHDKAEQRAKAAEEQQRASAYRIQQLLDQIKAQGSSVDANISPPESWAEFANWCDVNLTGRVVLSPTARREVRSPEFADFSLAARCLLWLANEGRDARINGSGGTIRDEPVVEGVRNAHCGSDTLDFYWQGNRYTADWHIKNGGNTRDPARCLRIYYAWDSATEQIIVAEMPAHRRTAAS